MKRNTNNFTVLLFGFFLLFSSFSSFASADPSNSSVLLEKSSDTFSPADFPFISSYDLAQQALAASGNTGYTASAVPSSIVVPAAEIFVGSGYTLKMESGGFWYYSKDGLRRVRTGRKFFVDYQANFEKFSRPGYLDNYRTSNYHVNVTAAD